MPGAGASRYALGSFLSQLVAGGGFDCCGDVKSWDGINWNNLDGGMNGDVRAVAKYGGGELAAGGEFSTDGYIARYTGSTWEPLAGGLRLLPGSPCIDAADNSALTIDAEQCSPALLDPDGNPRFLGDPCHGDTGDPDGTLGVVDMGAREFQGSSCDVGGDGNVGVEDLLIVLALWGPCVDCSSCPGDFNGDCEVGVNDFLTLLANWG